MTVVESPLQQIFNDPSFKHFLPKPFYYGAATAAYQVEGSIDADGKGPNVWDVCLSKQDNGSLAYDSYRLWKEDLELIKGLGSNTYRFSIAWSRVKPKGKLRRHNLTNFAPGGRDDPVNEAGIEFYSKMIDDLLAAGITPFVTIFHWDHPQELERRYGGFYNDNEMVADFVAYARLCFERFGDRVKHWITINEPHIFTMQSSSSYKQPGWKHKVDHARFARTLLLCHAYTFELYQDEFKKIQEGTIGITFVRLKHGIFANFQNCDWVEPLDDTAKAKEAAAWALDWVLGFYADPIFLGSFPPSVVQYLGSETPTFTSAEWKVIKGSSEFFGWNHYGTQLASGKRLETDNPRLVSFGSLERVFEKEGKPIGNKGEAGHPYDVPWGCRKLIRHISSRYSKPNRIPIYITEIGFSIDGEASMSLEDRIHDTQRQTYYAGYLKELFEAIRDDGIDLRGVMVWSLMDNLEWLYGFDKRFGITAVDMEDGCKRYPKDSTAVLRKIFEYALTT